MRSFPLAVLALGGYLPFTTAAPVTTASVPRYDNTTAEVSSQSSPNQTAPFIPSPTDRTPYTGKYIVTLRRGLSSRDLDSHLGWVDGVHARNVQRRSTTGLEKTFQIHSFNGYAGEFDENTLEQIESSPDVVAVERDQIWSLNDVTHHHHPDHPKYPDDLDTLATHSQHKASARPQSVMTQNPATWGLGRLSHRNPGSAEYLYDGSAGEGTYAYLIDTGLYTGHSEFEGRATTGYNALPGTSDSDRQGHGTHTAGTVGGKTFGVAKRAQLIGVKVFDEGGGLTSNILDGFNWAVSDIRSKGRVGKAVINMSLGGGHSDAFNAAVQAAYDAGIVAVVAAGNQGRDVGNDSPASSPAAITVGAVDQTDTQPSYSNFGRAVDIYAPGSNILSAGIAGPTATITMSGTSMATPHVAGLVLYLMAKEGLASPDALVAKLKHLADEGLVRNLGPGSPNLLAYNGL
ncbi:Basic amino-acid permease [Coniochaeta pulveracea]|uniref:Basic amino-acid permease n=1 Tax=Coniochaeta pulveracea TaxID=177199 RepID=A0A420Y7H4_9PEZI|nr:Basic amino-acid permease [Coniochaeta pulveracea]